MKRTTIYDIINRFESGKNAKHQSGGGRPAKIFNKQAKKKLKRLVNNKDGVSQRKLAGCFQCTQSYVNRVIKSMGIQKYKKQKIQDRSDQQKEAKRAKSATLYRKYRDREWILDDESYFTKTHSTINGNDNFYSDNIDFAPANVKFRRKHKYEKKLLVWIAMSPRGISEPFIMASGNAVATAFPLAMMNGRQTDHDQFVYRDSCLAPRLLPFIKKKSF